MSKSMGFLYFYLINTCLLMIPFTLSWEMFYYFDSGSYYLNGSHFVIPAAKVLLGQDPLDFAWWQETTLYGARSPAYGAFVFLARTLNLPILLALLQASAGAWMITSLFRHLFPSGFGLASVLTVAAMLVISPLGIFTNLMMPDIWAGIGVGVIALLVVFWPRLSWWEVLLSCLIVGVSTEFHKSHMLLYLTLAICGFGLLIWPGIRAHLSGKALVMVFASTVLGALFMVPVDRFMRALPGLEILDIPHLTAHLNDGGPGVLFARTRCDDAAFELCKHSELVDYDWIEFMFRSGLTKEERIAMGSEDLDFFLQTFKSYPIQTGLFLLRDGLAQLVSIDTSDITLTNRFTRYLSTLDLSQRNHIERSIFFDNPEYLDYLEWVTVASSLIGLGIVARLWWRGALTGPAAMVVLICLGGVLLNGLICGSAASPYGRFQVRIVWLIALCAAIAITAAITRRDHAQ